MNLINHYDQVRQHFPKKKTKQNKTKTKNIVNKLLRPICLEEPISASPDSQLQANLKSKAHVILILLFSSFYLSTLNSIIICVSLFLFWVYKMLNNDYKKNT